MTQVKRLVLHPLTFFAPALEFVETDEVLINDVATCDTSLSMLKHILHVLLLELLVI